MLFPFVSFSMVNQNGRLLLSVTYKIVLLTNDVLPCLRWAWHRQSTLPFDPCPAILSDGNLRLGDFPFILAKPHANLFAQTDHTDTQGL